MKRRIMLVVTVALVTAAMMVAMAMPAFATHGGWEHGGSFASDSQLPREGQNFGHCRSHGGLGGQLTAEWNPSYHGGKEDKQNDISILCEKA